MLNQLVVVGRLVRDPEVKELEKGNKVSNITLAVPRSYKNENGEYDTDFIDCTLWGPIAENTVEYCHKGDLIGIKGRIQTRTNEDKKIMEIVAEKATFLSSKKEKGE
jgi:single-strand DNA-binding protein